MVHADHTRPHRLADGLFSVPDRLLVIGFVALVVVTAAELVLVLAPLWFDPPWVPVPTLLPEDPFIRANFV